MRITTIILGMSMIAGSAFAGNIGALCRDGTTRSIATSSASAMLAACRNGGGLAGVAKPENLAALQDATASFNANSASGFGSDSNSGGNVLSSAGTTTIVKDTTTVLSEPFVETAIKDPVLAIDATLADNTLTDTGTVIAVKGPVLVKDPVYYEEPVLTTKDPVLVKDPVYYEEPVLKTADPVLVKEPVAYEEPVLQEGKLLAEIQ